MVALNLIGGCGMVLEPLRVLIRKGLRQIVLVIVLMVAMMAYSFF